MCSLLVSTVLNWYEVYRVQTAKNIKNAWPAWVKIGYQTMFIIRGCLYVPACAHIPKIAGGGGGGWDDLL